jgi:hypothetical protein
MILVPATKESEAGQLPSEELLREMGKFNEELVRAGVMLAGEGLQASAKGARVAFKDGKTAVIDGPFTESKELIAGYWIWQCKSKQEAIDWLKRAPFNHPAHPSVTVEIRQIFEASDFAEVDPTGEVRKHEEMLRAQISKQ